MSFLIIATNVEFLPSKPVFVLCSMCTVLWIRKFEFTITALSRFMSQNENMDRLMPLMYLL